MQKYLAASTGPVCPGRQSHAATAIPFATTALQFFPALIPYRGAVQSGGKSNALITFPSSSMSRSRRARTSAVHADHRLSDHVQYTVPFDLVTTEATRAICLALPATPLRACHSPDGPFLRYVECLRLVCHGACIHLALPLCSTTVRLCSVPVGCESSRDIFNLHPAELTRLIHLKDVPAQVHALANHPRSVARGPDFIKYIPGRGLTHAEVLRTPGRLRQLIDWHLCARTTMTAHAVPNKIPHSSNSSRSPSMPLASTANAIRSPARITNQHPVGNYNQTFSPFGFLCSEAPGGCVLGSLCFALARNPSRRKKVA